MNRKRFLLLNLVFLLVLSSCVQRRFNALTERRDRILSENQKELRLNFYPDDIDKYSTDDYQQWYSKLKTPPILQLPAAQEPKSLTNEQMVEDFEFYFKEIKENYPFFEVLKRNKGVDFLENHDKYLKKIKACKDDKDFIAAMKDIALDLNNNHVTIADRDYVEKTLNYYSNYWNNPAMYWEFLNFNKQKVRNRYKLQGLQSNTNLDSKEDRKTQDINNQDEQITNLSISEVDEGIAIIKINEMLPDYMIEDDKKKLENFLENDDKYDKLIIDIRDNKGGNMSYWQDFLLPYLLKEEKSITNHMFFRNGNRTKSLVSLEKNGFKNIEDIDLSNFNLENKEDLEKFSYYKENVIDIKPRKGYDFSGKIYLLVNDKVFSAAEGFANFAKNSDFATIIGTRTGGDGITIGIINEFMPNSGLVFTYTNTLGYTPDGSINEEKKTEPDIQSQSYKDSIEIIKNTNN